MRILHLTDLHYSHNNPFQITLTEALIKDLKTQSDAESFDALVFSGDIVNRPDDHNVYQQFEHALLNPILSAVGLGPSDVIFCPGNHDINRKTVEAWSDERSKMVAALRDQVSLEKHIAAGPTTAYLKAIAEDFFSLAERCGATWSNPLWHIYDFPSKNVSFVALNSAFGCGPEGSEYDRGKLAFPGQELLRAFQAVPAGRTIYSLIHHTPADFNEATTRAIKPILIKNSAIHFFGHVHQPLPAVEQTPGGKCFMVQGGALYEKLGYYNGYAIDDIGPAQEVRASYRTYWIDRLEFDVGTNVGSGGVFYSSPQSENFWHKAASLPDNDDICLWLMGTEKERIAEIDVTITSRSLTETFIDPVIKLFPKDQGPSSTPLTTTAIVQGKDNLVIAADSEYGATSLLSFLTLQFHKECVSLVAGVVPSLIDARRITDAYPAKVTSVIRSGLPDSSEPHLKLQPIHDVGKLVVLVDNLDFGNPTHVNFIKGARAQYPKARLIVVVKMPFVEVQRLRPVLGIDDFIFCQLGTLTRGKVRALVEKWKLPSRYENNIVVEEIHTRFLALGIPLTAAYVVIYLSILQDIDGFNPINSSTVIEQFVEGALQKYKPAYIFRSAFDYRNQIDYLGAMAERMCKKNSFSIEYEELYSWTKEYFYKIGMEHDYSKLISHFIDVKVFSRDGNSIFFSYNIFLSYFIAHQMLRSPDFKEWIKGDQRYTSYITEIDIYCGLSRQDVGLLDFFASEFERISAQLEDLVKPLAWVDRLEKLSLPVPKKSETTEFTDRIQQQLTMPTDKRDEAVSDNIPEKSVTPDVKRAEITGLLPNWVLSLRAFTVCLKNLENIPKETKEQNLTKVLGGWSKLLLYASIVFKEIVDNKEFAVGPMRFKLEASDSADARVLRLIFLSIPLYISDLLRRDLGSQKLSLQLKDDSLADTLSDSFLQTGLYADLKLPEYMNRLKKLKDKATEAKAYVILEVLLLKMRDIFLRLGFSSEDQDSFIQICAELSADLKGLTGDDRQREVDRYAQDLRKNDQIKKIREQMR